RSRWAGRRRAAASCAWHCAISRTFQELTSRPLRVARDIRQSLSRAGSALVICESLEPRPNLMFQRPIEQDFPATAQTAQQNATDVHQSAAAAIMISPIATPLDQRWRHSHETGHYLSWI